MAEKTWLDELPRPGNRRFKRVESVSPWFELYQIDELTYALLEPYHEEEVISYLLMGTERALLIDTGMGIGNIKKEVDKLTDLPVIVVNTHGHFDHMGDNHRFNEVRAFDDHSEVALIERGHSNIECAEYMGTGAYVNLPTGFNPTTYEVQPSPVTRRLKHLETIELGARTLTVHHTPGHSPGSICLRDSRDGLLFTGDTVYPGTLVAHLDCVNVKDYVASLNYLENLLDRVSNLCPAHNEAYAPKTLIAEIIDAFRQINAGKIEGEVQNKTILYRFEQFGIRLAHI